MAKTLTLSEIQNRNAWFRTVFFPATKKLVDSAIVKCKDYTDFYAAAENVLDVIINTKFAGIDNEIITLADAVILNNQSDPITGELSTKYTPEAIAGFIASFCAEKQIYWEDIRHNSYTLVEIKTFKDTILGKALSNFECYVSDDPVLKQTQVDPATNTTTIKPSSGAYSSSSGSLLNISNCAGLIQPANKVNPNQNYVYWIKGNFLDPAAKTNPRIHVSPVNGSNPLRVKYKSGQGRDDCILYFFDSSEANIFLQKCQQNCKDPKVDVSSFVVKKTGTDSNGYFKVNTEFGEAYITAKKLHEMLEAYNEEDAEFYNNLKEECDKLTKMTKEEYHEYMKNYCESSRRFFD